MRLKKRQRKYGRESSLRARWNRRALSRFWNKRSTWRRMIRKFLLKKEEFI